MSDLWKAFEETHYIVYHQPPFTLRVGENSPELDSLLQTLEADCAAFITAWNPMSRTLGDAENSRRQKELMAELDRRGLSYLPGIGQHPNNGWLGEESILVLSLQLEAARSLAKDWEQLGFVWVACGNPVHLVLT